MEKETSMRRKKETLASFFTALALLFFFASIGRSTFQQKSEENTRKAYAKMRELLLSDKFRNEENRVARRQTVKGVMADYDSEPRLSADTIQIGSTNDKKRVDIDRLVKHCEDLGVNCYHFLVWHQPSDWEDFQSFVTAAEKSGTLARRNFTIWVHLVPPSESQEMKSEPFGMDYIAWMENIAKFSKNHPGVTAVCIYDFYGSEANRNLYTRDYLRRMREAADKYNPKLALVTVLYWEDVDLKREAEILEEAGVIADSIDGILYPYMAQSLRKGLSHQDTSQLASEIKRVRDVYPGLPVIVDVYVTKHSGSKDFPDPKWVGEMLDISKANADGVALYCMPKKNKDGSFSDSWKNAMRDAAGIFNAVKSRYGAWLRSKW
jgi:hypothetical protein